MKHFIFKIATVNCDTETEETYLTRFDKTYTKEDIEVFLNTMLLDWYSGGYWLNKDKGQVMYPEGNLCYYSEFKEITPEDFKVLSNHHSDMTYKFSDLANEILDKKVILKTAGFKSTDGNIFAAKITVKDVNQLLTDLENLDISEEQIDIDYTEELNTEITITIDISLIDHCSLEEALEEALKVI